jgi:hypothetical protein
VVLFLLEPWIITGIDSLQLGVTGIDSLQLGVSMLLVHILTLN